jgi:hypothetical protein
MVGLVMISLAAVVSSLSRWEGMATVEASRSEVQVEILARVMQRSNAEDFSDGGTYRALLFSTEGPKLGGRSMWKRLERNVV